MHYTILDFLAKAGIQSTNTVLVKAKIQNFLDSPFQENGKAARAIATKSNNTIIRYFSLIPMFFRGNDDKNKKFLYLKRFLFACLSFFILCSCEEKRAKELTILVTITPLYSLIKNVTGDLQNVQLLIDKNMCPHDYQMRPSDIRKINRADLLITIGDGFEVFLFKYLNKASIKGEIVKLVNIDGLTLLSLKKASHNHIHMNDYNHDHHYNNTMNIDWNFWPYTKNAKVIVQWIASRLSAQDPGNAQVYLKNAKDVLTKISKLDLKMRAKLTPVQNKNFIVLNDEYQYIEKEYGLSNVGTITIDKSFGYSAKKIDSIKKIVKKKQARCIFIELHTPKELAKKIAHITGAKVAYLDIEWGRYNKKISDGEVYFSMMEQNAQNISACLLN